MYLMRHALLWMHMCDGAGKDVHSGVLSEGHMIRHPRPGER